MDKKIKNLLKEDAAVLFREATRLSKENNKLIFACPIGMTTICKTDPHCSHCQWQSKAQLNPYYARQMTLEEVTASAKDNQAEGTNRVYLPSGCQFGDLPEFFFEYVAAIRANFKGDLWGFFGPISKNSLKQLKVTGLDGYWCGIEIANESLFKKVRPGDNFKDRMQTLRDAKDIGLKTWSGIVYGLGESENDLVRGINMMQEMDVNSVAIFPFTPCPDTPMEACDPPNLYKWAKLVAATKISLPKADFFANPDYSLWAYKAGINGFVHMYTKSTGSLPSKKELTVMRENAFRSLLG